MFFEFVQNYEHVIRTFLNINEINLEMSFVHDAPTLQT
jgi:hypothetical protein